MTKKTEDPEKGVWGINRRPPADDGAQTCGGCRWLDGSYTGRKTCRTHFGASEDTKVCADFTPIDPLTLASIPSLRKNAFIKKKTALLEHPTYFVDDSLIDELIKIREEFKAVRDEEKGIPTYFTSEKDAEQLATMFKRVHAYRERVVKIITDLKPMQRNLQKIWDRCEMYLMKYPLLADQTSETKRNKILRSIMPDLTERMETLDSIITTAERLDSFLNSTHFMLKEIKDIAMAVLEIRKASRFHG